MRYGNDLPNAILLMCKRLPSFHKSDLLVRSPDAPCFDVRDIFVYQCSSKSYSHGFNVLTRCMQTFMLFRVAEVQAIFPARNRILVVIERLCV